MDFKSLLTKIGELQQVKEAKEDTATGVKHKGKYGTEYQGDADDEDTDGDKKKAKKAVAPAEKRGRGRPKKGADSSTGKLATYSGAKDLQDYIVGNKPSKAVEKLPKKKHTLKDWVEQIEGKYIVEAGLAVQPMPTTPQQKQQQQMASKPAFMIKDPANPTASAITTSDPAVVNAAKNGTLTMQKPGATPTTPGAQPAQGAGSQVAPVHEEEDGKWIKGAIKHPGAFTKKATAHGMTPAQFRAKVLAHKEDYPAKTEKQAQLAKTLSKLSHGKVKEADIPPTDSLMSPISESSTHSMRAAHHSGKAHALAREGYNCRYDDMEEARMYHSGYKEGLDECYGQMPIQGYVGEANPSIVDDMASFGAHHDSDVEEGNAFTGALARTPHGGQFSVGGKRFKDRTNYDAPIDEMQSMAFEGWNNQLDKLLTEGDVSEGMSVSISKGQQGAPDSVSVTANDADADALLNLVKHAGLGLFGNEGGQGAYGAPTDGTDSQAHGDIAVVNDHDGMMSLMKKLSGVETGSSEGSDDYADEEGNEEEQEEPGHEHEEEVCGDCGEADCACDVSDDSEEVDEDQTDDQLEYQMAEDTEEDAGVAAAGAQQAGEDAALASAAGEADAADEEEPEEVEESYANGADDTFEADIDFMTKVISGGLNKQKSTGQSTIPVVASQTSRLGNPMQESTNLLPDWKKLSGIK